MVFFCLLSIIYVSKSGSRKDVVYRSPTVFRRLRAQTRIDQTKSWFNSTQFFIILVITKISLSLFLSFFLFLSPFFVCSAWRKCEGKENYCLKGKFVFFFLFHTFVPVTGQPLLLLSINCIATKDINHDWIKWEKQ